MHFTAGWRNPDLQYSTHKTGSRTRRRKKLNSKQITWIYLNVVGEDSLYMKFKSAHRTKCIILSLIFSFLIPSQRSKKMIENFLLFNCNFAPGGCDFKISHVAFEPAVSITSFLTEQLHIYQLFDGILAILDSLTQDAIANTNIPRSFV